jgi:hypothetical protein
MNLAPHVTLDCPNCEQPTYDAPGHKRRCVECKKDVGTYAFEVLKLAFPNLTNEEIWGPPAPEPEVKPKALAEFTPWLTERMRFQWDGLTVTLHSTGQVWMTKPDGVLYAYLEMPCRFACMKLLIDERRS